MPDKDYKQFREIIRALEKKFGVLEDSGYSCCGITLAQCHALIEIGRAGSMSLNGLAEAVNLESSTVSRTVNHLVTGGLAERADAQQDRRFVTIRLTEAGLTLFSQIEQAMDQYFQEIFCHLPEDKRGQVLESLALIVDAVNSSCCCGGENCCN